MVFNLLKSQLRKMQNVFSETGLILGKKVYELLGKPRCEETLDHLEQILYEADVGSSVATHLVKQMRLFYLKHPHSQPKEFIEEIKKEVRAVLKQPSSITGHNTNPDPVQMILIIGVNGSGKTTSCAKLGYLFQREGKKVLFAAADTFRAAATEQLVIWSKRLEIDCIQGTPGGDPSAVIFDALTAAKVRNVDLVIADTAGRLESKTHLMKELSKITRVTKKLMPTAPHEIYLVLDATTGQNGIDQVETFHQFTPLTGLIFTKLDGSAKGGIILAIYHQTRIPVRYVGVGEGLDDLLPFDPDTYVDALFTT